ncbi:DUF2878 domain-containing protein [Thiococcus pfennigii]|uniref:DUF2878 domain-containing protein n=1 Tax=Thiococcus pfennigii TaxID=1057 RepID=UPI0019081552|nr:DUF2878 domain-containing protein [Thiococcus pfennigii]MBK1702131.1 hypothetical protein [Thiococcus pfennigii]MBK1731241.1 hypothetical protein [Thiococcus pfennigii]
MRIVANLVAFQLGWFACVLGGAHGLPWFGVALAAVIVGSHLWFAAQPAVEAKLLFAVAGIGSLWDGLLVGTGLLAYPSGMLAAWLPPVWMMALWLLFAMTLNVALRWLRGRWLVAASLGAFGGPLAFYTGAQLGGVTFAEPTLALAVIGAGWLLLTPLFVWLAARLDGQAPVQDAPVTPIRSPEVKRHV